MRFDVVVGNPPYQEDSIGGSTSSAPIYHHFMDRAYNVSDKVLLVTPARFLFNAGDTPKAWNERMLSDVHLRVLYYEENASRVFSTATFTGGVAITLHDNTQEFPPIGIYTINPLLNIIMDKVDANVHSVYSIVSGRGVYRLTDKALEDIPSVESLQSKGHKKDVGTAAFEILEGILFFENLPKDGGSYVKILGLKNSKRAFRWIRKEYLDFPKSLEQYKVFLSKANGAALKNGTIIGAPYIADKGVGATETFITIGGFDDKLEAENLAKYLKTRFARFMLSILKVTADNTKEKWSKVPLQDFTPQSDIDWTQSVPNIDCQLYAKYGLVEQEIAFIEEKVKPME